jgi:prevent-host-death family protein
MKIVSIDELKRKLASIIDEAAEGERIVITRHRRPVASLTRAGLEDVHVGRRASRGALRPLLKAATRGAYLEVLAEDRRPGAGPLAVGSRR